MGRITDSLGNSLVPVGPLIGSYVVNMSWRHTGTGLSLKTWALQNLVSNQRVCRIRSISGIGSFDGTAAASTHVGWQWSLEEWKDTMSGGTQIFPCRKRSAYGGSSALVRVLDTGLTGGTNQDVAGPGNVGPIGEVFIPISVTNKPTPFQIRFDSTRDLKADDILIYPGGVLLCSTLVSAVIGATMTGCVEFDEYEFDGFSLAI